MPCHAGTRCILVLTVQNVCFIYQHVFRKPALSPREHGAQAQRETLLTQKTVAAVAASCSYVS